MSRTVVVLYKRDNRRRSQIQHNQPEHTHTEREKSLEFLYQTMAAIPKIDVHHHIIPPEIQGKSQVTYGRVDQ